MCLATIDVKMKDSVLCERGHELKGSGGIVYLGVEHEWAGASGNERVRHEVEGARWVKIGVEGKLLTGAVEIGIRCHECPWEKVAGFELPYFQRLLLKLEAGKIVSMERVAWPQ